MLESRFNQLDDNSYSADDPKSVCNRCVFAVFDGVSVLSLDVCFCSDDTGVFVLGLSHISSLFSVNVLVAVVVITR